MFAFGRSRAGARAVAIAAALIVFAGMIFAGSAEARQKAKPRAGAAGHSADIIPIPKFSSGDAPLATRRPDAAATPMRFFTINDALARFEDRADGKVRHAAVTPADRASDLPPPVASLPLRGEEPFGMFSFRAPQGALWTKWTTVQRAVAAEGRRLLECQANAYACDDAARTLAVMAKRASALDGRQRFEAVTHDVNAAVRYTTDHSQHGVIDQWTAPLATLAAGRGDCEDYAILKYQVLREAGTPAADLRIVLLRDTASREDHAVLAARSGERWYILDNRRAGFYLDSDLPHYMPLFALNHDGVQLLAAPYALRPSQPAEDAFPAMADDAGRAPPVLMAFPVLL